MKCVAIKDVKEFEITDMKQPEIDHENVVLEVKKTGICGSDIHYWVAGEPKGLVMGHEFSGVVKDPGSRTDLKKGDRVIINTYSGSDVKYEGEEYKIVRQSDILAIID